MVDTSQWTDGISPNNGKHSNIGDFIGDFKNCFGNYLNIDLSDEDDDERTKTLTVAAKDYDAIISDQHPFINPNDFDTAERGANDEGPVTIGLQSSRLKGLLLAYAYEQMPRLFDQRKSLIRVDTNESENLKDSIFKAVHDYIASGLIMLAPNTTPPSSEIIDQMLEMAWNEAVQIHSKPQQTYQPGR